MQDLYGLVTKKFGESIDIPMQVRQLDPQRPDASSLFLLVLEGENSSPTGIGIYAIAHRITVKEGFGRQIDNHHNHIVSQYGLKDKTILGGSSFSFAERTSRGWDRTPFLQKITGRARDYGSIFPQVAVDINRALLDYKAATGTNLGTERVLHIHTQWPKIINKEIGQIWKNLGYYDFPADGTVAPVNFDVSRGKIVYSS